MSLFFHYSTLLLVHELFVQFGNGTECVVRPGFWCCSVHSLSAFAAFLHTWLLFPSCFWSWFSQYEYLVRASERFALLYGSNRPYILFKQVFHILLVPWFQWLPSFKWSLMVFVLLEWHPRRPLLSDTDGFSGAETKSFLCLATGHCSNRLSESSITVDNTGNIDSTSTMI